MQPDVINPETTPPAPASPQAPISPQPSPAPNQPSTNKKGHLNSLTKFILFVVIVALFSGGTYYWQHKKASDANTKVVGLQSQLTSLNKQVATLQKTISKTTPLTTMSKSATAAPHPTSTTPSSYFTISQWGVRAPYNGSLTLKYVVDPYDANEISLSSAQMEAAGSPNNDGVNVCAYTDNGEAGHIERYLPSDTIDAMGIPPNTTAEQYIQQNPTTPHSTIGQYTYIYWSYLKNGTYNGPCSTAVTEQTMNAYAALIPQLTSY